MSGAPGSSFWMATLAASVEHSGGGGGVGSGTLQLLTFNRREAGSVMDVRGLI